MKDALKKYDIVFVVRVVRNVTYFLNIMKALGKSYRFGIIDLSDRDSRIVDFKKRYVKDFLDQCVHYGAEIVDSYPLETQILFIAQEPYLNEDMAFIKNNVDAKKTIAYLHLCWPGINDQICDFFDIQKAYVVHQTFFDYLLSKRGDRSIYDKTELKEVGIPYKKYPVFEDFEADYIMAIPTAFSFPHEHDKWFFLKTVLELFSKMNKNDRVVYKPHNAKESDYFSPELWNKKLILKMMSLIPESFLRVFFRFIDLNVKNPKKLRILRYYTSYLFEKIQSRIIPIQNLTSRSFYAMEAFLPLIKKGVIGGLSNTIWGSLYFRLPFYNCVDMSQQKRDSRDKLYKKDAAPHLETNIKFFNIPYCDGQLEFDEKLFQVVEDSVLDGDVIEELKKDLLELRDE